MVGQKKSLKKPYLRKKTLKKSQMLTPTMPCQHFLEDFSSTLETKCGRDVDKIIFTFLWLPLH